MKGKIVKADDPGFLQFFYPDYVIRESLSLMDSDSFVIYTGKQRNKIKDWLGLNTKGFISTVGNYEIDFTSKEPIIKWCYGQKGKEVPQRILDQISYYDDEYFKYLVKVFWITGRWVGSTNSDVTMFNLFQDSIDSTRKFLSTYYELLKDNPPEVIEASFLTFLGRVVDIENQTVSQGYMKLLRQANARYGSKIKPAILALSMRKDSDPVMSFLDLATNLR